MKKFSYMEYGEYLASISKSREERIEELSMMLYSTPGSQYRSVFEMCCNEVGIDPDSITPEEYDIIGVNYDGFD